MSAIHEPYSSEGTRQGSNLNTAGSGGDTGFHVEEVRGIRQEGRECGCCQEGARRGLLEGLPTWLFCCALRSLVCMCSGKQSKGEKSQMGKAPVDGRAGSIGQAGGCSGGPGAARAAGHLWGGNLPALPLPAPLPRPCSGCSRTQVSFLPLKCKANSQVCWCVCCVQRLLPPAACLWPRPPLLFGPPRDVGPEPGVQEGSRTSQPCSLARAGQGRDHSGEAAGPGGEQAGCWQASHLDRGLLGCPSPAQNSEGPVWVGSGEGPDRPEGWLHWTQASELCWGPSSRAQQILLPAKSQFCS